METEKSDKKLLLYIQTQIEAGVSREEIIKRLSKVKWNESQINAGLNAYDRGEREKCSLFCVVYMVIGRVMELFLLLIMIAVISIIMFYIINYIEHAEERRNHGGNDAAIKQTMGNIRSQAEISYHKKGNVYSAVCGSDGFDHDVNVIKLLRAAEINSSFGEKAICNSRAEAYAVSARLSAQNASYWCVDSSGFSGLLLRSLNPGELQCPLDVAVKNKY